MVERVREASLQRQNRLPVDRFGRRHQADQGSDSDFGASDAPMKDEDLKAAPGEVLHIPTVLGAVVITYNLAGVNQPLHFSSEVLADIFLGKIKKWNDPKIAADNPGVSLPAKISRSSIVRTAVVRRQCSQIIFRKSVRSGKRKWEPARRRVGPSVLGGKGNEGVTGQVKTDAEHDRLRRAGVRGAEQTAVALVKNCERQLHRAVDRCGHRGGGCIRGQHARGPARVDNQRDRRAGLSDLELHLHPRLQGPERRGQRQSPRRLSLVGDS